MKTQYDFTPKFNRSFYSAQTDTWKVELVDLGEGNCGDYNPDDINDEPLLRFDYSSRKNKHCRWSEPNDSSYCTQINANRVEADVELRKRILVFLLSQFCNEDWDTNIKKDCEQLSWISDLDEGFHE